ncbi:MAG: metalloregulator ArsR/SmtB family transcription factor [Endozoicomonas sp. (ex Botrylloides leachii)]|nr:metalloregulator ArsR/SmtB family transcription factor [Endozoicomonas sp. (ex Botrylloides leachii)]
MADTQIPCCSHLPELSSEQHDRLAAIFRLLGDEGRLRLVMACIDAPQTVTHLAALSSMSQPLTSHHLRQLRSARILKPTRVGKQVFYELDDYHIRHVLVDLATHVLESKCEH